MGEEQTPMHYAAKNNAAASLKTMLRLGAHINERDYKKRTPLFVASETGRPLISNGTNEILFLDHYKRDISLSFFIILKLCVMIS